MQAMISFNRSLQKLTKCRMIKTPETSILYNYITCVYNLNYLCKHLNIEVHVHVYNDSLPHSPCTPLTKYMYIYIGYLSVTLAI